MPHAKARDKSPELNMRNFLRKDRFVMKKVSLLETTPAFELLDLSVQFVETTV